MRFVCVSFCWMSPAAPPLALCNPPDCVWPGAHGGHVYRPEDSSGTIATCAFWSSWLILILHGMESWLWPLNQRGPAFVPTQDRPPKTAHPRATDLPSPCAMQVAYGTTIAIRFINNVIGRWLEWDTYTTCTASASAANRQQREGLPIGAGQSTFQHLDLVERALFCASPCRWRELYRHGTLGWRAVTSFTPTGSPGETPVIAKQNRDVGRHYACISTIQAASLVAAQRLDRQL